MPIPGLCSEGLEMTTIPKGQDKPRRSHAGPDPDTAPVFLNMRQVRARTSLGEMTIRRLAEQGAFPRLVRLAPQRVAWRKADVDAWETSRVEVG